jgi:ribosomal protein S18 acetylase RimI-like enzyme
MSQQASSSIRIVRLTGMESDPVFSAIEMLHRVELSAGALAHMPHGFLRQFYRHMAAQHDLVVIGALEGCRVVGFVSGSMVDARPFSLVWRFARSNAGAVIAAAVRLMVRPTGVLRLVRLAGSLVRDRGQGRISGPQLLSIAVNRAEAARGIGRRLFEVLAADFMRRGVREFVVIAAHTQVSAMAFYERRGCIPVTEIVLGGLPCTVFRYAAAPIRDSGKICQTD